MTAIEVLAFLKSEGTAETVEGMTRYGIPNDNAFGVPMGTMKKFAKRIGKDHSLAAELWKAGWYETRTVAVFVDEAAKVTKRQMDSWASDFNNWAICDTACFRLFDQTAHAWDKYSELDSLAQGVCATGRVCVDLVTLCSRQRSTEFIVHFSIGVDRGRTTG